MAVCKKGIVDLAVVCLSTLFFKCKTIFFYRSIYLHFHFRIKKMIEISNHIVQGCSAVRSGIGFFLHSRDKRKKKRPLLFSAHV